ncbi:MAG: hypothetical protein KIS92_13175 [Planctomycetota bacterium]|nr:hypothetical protein [Planctomycetota bacterium]
MVLRIGLIFLCCAALLRTAAEDELRIGLKPTPSSRIVALANALSNPGEALAPAPDATIAAYVDLQWDVLTGKTPLAAKLKLNTPALTTKELEELLRWCQAHPRLKERLLLALDPEIDDLRAGARVALKLLRKLPEPADERFDRLIVAYAAVWDMPEHPAGEDSPSVKPMDYEESFAWLVKNERQLAPFFKEIPWRLLVFVASDRLARDERDWAQKIYNYHARPGQAYSDIPYDMDKLRGGARKNNLEKARAAYTLPNLFRYGGTCGDQAYFAREVCRALGVPAASVQGATNHGIDHAWVVWVDRDANGFYACDHGKYKGQGIFSGMLFDPRDGTRIPDGQFEQLVRQWSKEDEATRAELYWRIARDFRADLKAGARLNLYRAALAENPAHREAWLGLAEAVSGNALPRGAAATLWELLTGHFDAAPEFVFEMAKKLAESFVEDREQFEFFERAAAYFVTAGRLDLACRLRQSQVDLLIAKDKLEAAARAAAQGVVQCAGEGANLAELAKTLANVCRRLKRPADAIEPLKAAVGRLAPVANFKVNPTWMELSELLRDLYQETGDTASADESNRRLNSVRKNVEGFR